MRTALGELLLIVRHVTSAALRLYAVPCALLWPREATAQLSDIRGVVLDSASRTPVAGAVVMLLDTAGATLVRTLTSERGQYRLVRPGEATQLRVVRIGFAPAVLPLSVAVGRSEGGYQLDVPLARFASALQGIDIAVARGCKTRPDRAGAIALLEDARAGLLAAVVARERDPPQLTVLRFDRLLDVDGIETVEQSVRVDSSPNASASFAASRSVADFLSTGFRSGAPGEYTFFGPDADVLLDDRFLNGYCFDMAPPDVAHPQRVGVHFAPAARRNGRVDISGTLWIDTAARALSELQFRYVGVEPLAEGLGAGGQVTFRALPNGVPFIDRWWLRLVGGRAAESVAVTTQRFTVREIGGELAEARWPDGRVWSAPLGAVSVVTHGSAGLPVPGAVLRLVGTDYVATANRDGLARFANLLPGPYTISVDDPTLRPLGLALSTERTVVAARGSTTIVRARIPAPVSLLQEQCERADTPKSTESWLLARTMSRDNRPLASVRWQLRQEEAGQWKARTRTATTGPDGVIALCRDLVRGSTIELVTWRTGTDTVRVRQELRDPVVALRVDMPEARASESNGRTAGAPVTIGGMVVDSVTGAPVADARITLVGFPVEGASDVRGHFVIGGITRGRYTVEVGTSVLDSVGVVWRREIDVRGESADLRLFAPRGADGVSAACGATESGGLLVGRVSSAEGTPTVAAGYRVIAEWGASPSAPVALDSLGRSRPAGALATTPDARTGTFRLCGVPVGQELIVRAELASAPTGIVPRQQVRVHPSQRIARVDLRLGPPR